MKSGPDPIRSETEPDSARQPLSSAALDAHYEAVKANPPHVGRLRELGLDELVARARAEGIEPGPDPDHGTLVFELARHLGQRDGLIFSEGILEILPDGFGFLRSPVTSYRPSPSDIYVSPSQIRRFRMRAGDLVQGQLRPPLPNERFFAMLRIEAVNWHPPEAVASRTHFDSLTPVYPDQRLLLESGPTDLTGRLLDLLAPIGLGQRGLIVAPPRAGKTVILQSLARAIVQRHPSVTLMVLLIDERPEEVTEMERAVDAEVIASTFDEPASRHVQTASTALQRARRLVELGGDVVILLDSITRLARAHNTEVPSSGRVLSGGVDATALQVPKRFFGSARNVEGHGSLTILATTLVETGSRMDEVIFEEFKGTGNMEVVLDRRLADQRLYPAIDIQRTGTRREELLLDPEEARRVATLRRQLASLSATEGLKSLLRSLRRTSSNAEYLLSLQPGPAGDES